MLLPVFFKCSLNDSRESEQTFEFVKEKSLPCVSTNIYVFRKAPKCNEKLKVKFMYCVVFYFIHYLFDMCEVTSLNLLLNNFSL